ncbi:translocation/assembly module TamB domain-containing protein [Anaerospora sp.]|uniref:translocation/assembly module TamB domain-containing protein n=1 Tax=Anaerospora sp. TaxID=1960278 RepID=UPI0028A284E0|nr:translocation/assembly module TamB domain-containing protein [Anaerospora sp.]
MRYKAWLLLLAIVVTIGAAFWTSQSENVLGRAQNALVEEMNKMLNGQVTFKRLEITSFRSAVLYDAVIQDNQGQIVASAAKVTARFDLWAALQGEVALAAIKEVELSEPGLFLVRQSNGLWNIEQLLKNQNNQEMSFAGLIKLTNGQIHLLHDGVTYTVADINGSFNFIHKPAVAFSVAGTFQGEPIVAEGSVKSKDSLFARLKVSGLDLTTLKPMLPADHSIVVHSGQLENVTATVRQEQGVLAYAGEAQVHKLAVDASGISVKNGEASLTFTHQNLYLYQASGTVNEQPVQGHGRITLDTSEPVLDLAVQSAGIDPTAFDKSLPVSGKFAVQATVRGLATNPEVQGEIVLEKGSIAGVTVEEAKGSVLLSDGLLTLKRSAGKTLGGAVTLEGQLDTATRRYQGRVRGTGIDSSQVPGVPVQAAGRADFDVMLDGEDFSQPAISGTAVIKQGRWNALAIDEVATGFSWSGKSAIIDYLNITAGQAKITAKGSMQDEQLALTLLGRSIPLGLIGAQTSADMSGTLDFEGTAGGSLSHPVLTVDFKARDGQVLQQPFSSAAGTLLLTPDQLKIEQATIVNRNTTHNLAGTVELSGDHPVNLVLVTKAARAETLIAMLMPGEQLTGNVDNEVVLTGSLADLNAQGHFRLYDGSFRGQLISSIEGRYQRHQGVISLENVVLQSLNTEVQLAGTISADQQLNFNLAAKDIELAKLSHTAGYPMSGKASFVGHLGGTVASPAFEGQLTADKLVLNRQEITGINGTVYSDGNRIHISHFGFKQNEGAFAFTGGMELASDTIYGTVTVENGQLGSLLTMLNSPVKEIDGKLNGSIVIGGTLDKPDIAVQGNLLAGKVKNYPLDNIEMDIALKNEVVTINTFSAKQGSGILVARGTANLNGPANLEIGGRDIDAGLLTAWLDSTVATSGKLTFSAEVTGQTQDPQMAISLQINDGKVANASFDELYGLFTVNKGSIHVNQVMLLKGPYKASAYGLVPIAALNKEGRAKASAVDQMNLTVTLDKANLSILPMLTNEVSWAVGDTKGQLKIGGTLFEPTVTGQFLVQDGTIKFKSLGQPIQKVAVDIQFEGDTMNIKAFNGSMGGGSYNLTGQIGWQGLTLTDYDVVLTLERLGVEHKYFKGPLQGKLQLTTNRRGRPLVAGNLLFENATIDIPLIPDLEASDLNVALDLEVVAGKRVRLYNSYLYDIMAEGKVKFGGSTQRPSTSGRISAVRGTVSYLRTSFKIKDAVADFTQVGSFMPVLRLDASTRLEQTTINLAITGPVQEMEMKLTAEPQMSQQEILSLLTLRSHYFDNKNGNDGRDSGLGRDEIVGLLDAGLQMRFISEMEGAFRKAFGIDEFRVVRGTLAPDDNKKDHTIDREVYNLEVGKYITDRLMLSYTMGVDHDERSMGFRYDLSRRFSVTASRDNKDRNLFGLEARFTF